MFKEVLFIMGIIKSGGIDSIILSGSVGGHTYRYTNSQLVVSEKTSKVNDRRSYEQIAHRTLMSNVSLTGKVLTSASFKFAFEDKNVGQTDYNMFTKYAMHYPNPVYITKQMREMKLCVPTEYEVSRGSLKSIQCTYDATEHAFVTNLIASAVTDSTIVGDFTIDFLTQNKSLRWQFDDKIVYVMLTGTLGDDGFVRFEVSGASLLLGAGDTARLSSVLPAMKVVGGKVAFDATTYSCIAVIHVRHNDGVLVSSQKLVLSDALKTYASAYQTVAAREAAMRSIGGWTDSLIGSKASTSIYEGEVVRDNTEDGSNGSSGSSGSSSSSGSSTGSGTTGNGTTGNGTTGDGTTGNGTTGDNTGGTTGGDNGGGSDPDKASED